ncbi:MAG: YdcF family protein [Blautia sp.]|nr:YdcF family protein [Blautia sp.]
MRDYFRFLQDMGDFVFAEDELRKADVIFVPGNGYPQMAERAAQLYLDGLAEYIIPSGRYSITIGHFAEVLERAEKYTGPYETEWEFLKDVLVKNGVPEEAVLREDQATYTYENAINTRKVTDAAGITVRTAILCCKNYHARRAKMYYELLFPEAEILVCPCAVDDVNKNNWAKTKAGVDAVTAETGRIVNQFSLMMQYYPEARCE